VDLDGTLVKSDTLVDSVLALARQNPRALLAVPGWLAQGKAAFKQQVTGAVTLDVASLPYNKSLLRYLTAEHAGGRALYLATAADAALASRVAAHLGLFAGTLASDGSHNLAGGNKLAAFEQRFGTEFSYIGPPDPYRLPRADGREPQQGAEPRAARREGASGAHLPRSGAAVQGLAEGDPAAPVG
jgi:hypothetical protein